MDPILNPYAPGAGTPPPELSGRNELRDKLKITIARILKDRPAKSMLLVGLRGVGKTVLLEQMLRDTEEQRIHTIFIEAPENRSLPAIICPQLRLAMLKLSRIEKSKEAAIRSLRALAGFVKGLKVTYGDIEVGLDYEEELGLADNGDLEADLTTLFVEVGKTAKAGQTAIALFIDELQYIKSEQFAALITALHRCAQLKLPVVLVGAGLPQLRGKAGNAKSYAERLFDYPEVGALDKQAATDALVKPALDEDVEFDADAINIIYEKTRGYPYFLQEWGKHSWDVAQQSPITSKDVLEASELAIAAMDESFFRVRFDRLTPKEKNYLYAMATLGEGPHRSGDIAAVLNKKVSDVAPVRNNLINKGMLWMPNHGDTSFTVPLFDQFMLRIMPGL
ncbi:AAA family ATPase [Vibrio albus]|uniref:AAA family ATPase n=1 Tax=Vibrio albus TaxID=2200953 RepID=A0A2U3BCN6_9VIBR|nr:ATP-binding protein [Vibrio albus]PWI34543.1 AAA family ATPase [Vibrio albus]